MSITKRVGAAIERGLYPIVRLLIEYGVSEAQFTGIARSVFVKVAAENIENGPLDLGNKVTATRIAVMTGIPRGAINPILNSTTVIGQDEWYRHLCADVLSAWHSTPKYLDKRGSPLPIPFAGPEPSFEALVEQNEKKRRSDVSPHAILDELKLVGAIEEIPINEADPDSGSMLYARKKTFRRVGSKVEDLENAMDELYNLASARHAVMIDGSRQVAAHGTVKLDARPESLPMLLRDLRDAADNAISQANSAMNLPDRQAAPGSDPSQLARVGIGVYVYAKDQMAESRFFSTTIDDEEEQKLANE